MSTVSNKIYVQAIDDGSTLHAQLLSTQPLSQAYTPSGCVPNWSNVQSPDIRPIIYLDLIHGTDKVKADAGGTWTYNGSPIEFNSSSPFELVTNYPTSANPTPAIRIKGNLANSDNVDTDSIGYTGSYTLSGKAISFTLTTFVRITGITANGIFGQIIFTDSSNIITEKNQNKVMYGRLYDASGNEIDHTLYTTIWQINDGGTSAGTDIGGYHEAFTVNEADITDNAVIRCIFSYTVPGTTTLLRFNAYETIDDQTDPEQMYIQSVVTTSAGTAVPDGGGMELHQGQQVEFRFWMGTMTNPTPDASWKDFYIRLHKSDGTIVTTSFPDATINDVNASYGTGYRKVDWDASNNYASIIFTYDRVKESFDKYLTGYIKATK